MSAAKTQVGVGVGPGDPELMTLKATRALGEADVVALFRQGRQRQQRARHRRRSICARACRSCRCFIR